MSVHLYDFRWRTPEDIVFEGSKLNRFGFRPIKKGEPLSLKRESSPRCAGSVTEGQWQPCPEKSIGKAKCDICRAREGQFVITSFDGFDTSQVTEKDLERLRVPHLVYLAFFAPGLCKVGVSQKERKVLRQLEQGSLATLFIAETPDGILARQIETLVRKSGLVGDKIQNTTKKDLLFPDISPEEAEKTLRSLFKKVPTCLVSHPHLQSYLANTPSFHFWGEHYQLDTLKKATLSFCELQPQEGISGKVLSIKGSFIILDTGSTLAAVNAKTLLGSEVSFQAMPPGIYLEKALQTSLF